MNPEDGTRPDLLRSYAAINSEDDTGEIPIVQPDRDWLWLFWVMVLVGVVCLIGFSYVSGVPGISSIPSPDAVSGPGRTHS